MARGKRVSDDIPDAAQQALKAIGRALRRERTERGDSQTAAGERLGVHVQTVARIEAGEPGVAAGHVLGMMALYGMAPALLALAPDDDPPAR